MGTVLIDKGYRPGRALLLVEEPESEHTEAAWTRRVSDALCFLLEQTYQPGPAALSSVTGTPRITAIWPGKPYPLGATWNGRA